MKENELESSLIESFSKYQGIHFKLKCAVRVVRHLPILYVYVRSITNNSWCLCLSMVLNKRLVTYAMRPLITSKQIQAVKNYYSDRTKEKYTNHTHILRLEDKKV